MPETIYGRNEIWYDNDDNNWITPGIRISHRHKRELYLLYRNNNDINVKSYYKSYCRILSSVINAAKRLYYDGLITNSKNKIKTTWNIVKSVTGKKFENKSPRSVCINGALTENHQVTADSFQSHFLWTADEVVSNINNNEDTNDINCSDYLYRALKSPYPNTIFDHTMTKKVDNIIKSLKLKNSCGYDEISVKILKINCPFITASLTYICNRSILSGSFPTRLEHCY
jgi:hypothetical protein